MSQKSDKLPSRALMIFIAGVVLFLVGLVFFMISPIVAIILVVAGGALAVWGYRLDQQDRLAAKQAKSAPDAAAADHASDTEDNPGRHLSSDAHQASAGSFRPSEPLPKEVLDDLTYIKAMQHHSSGPWHQYDILLDSSNYGWNDMLAWADYMADADLTRISTITSSEYIGAVATELIGSYDEETMRISELAGLSREQGVLAIGGISTVLQSPVKICWYNQTQALRFFSLTPDEDLMTRYIETMIRHTFGTPDAMKQARPQPVDAEPEESEESGE